MNIFYPTILIFLTRFFDLPLCQLFKCQRKDGIGLICLNRRDAIYTLKSRVNEGKREKKKRAGETFNAFI